MIFCYAATGFDGNIVIIETNIRRGIPGIDIVGLPDGAVRESRDRIRVALRVSILSLSMRYQSPAEQLEWFTYIIWKFFFKPLQELRRPAIIT